MFWRKNKTDDERNEKLDKIGKLLLKSAALSEQEIEQLANSPLPYARLRSNIMKETLKRSEAGDSWFAILSIARYAIPVMVCVALIALGAFWALGTGVERYTNFSSPEYLSADMVAPVTACSISSKTECVVSSNDVLSIVFQPQAQGTEIKK